MGNKNGIFEVEFMGKIQFEVYIWTNSLQIGYIGSFETYELAREYFLFGTKLIK